MLACSGGIDSMVMLSLFLKAYADKKNALVVGHVNHHLRAEAGSDQEFLTKFCESHNVRWIVEHVDVDNRCQQTGESEEMAARHLRYEALEKMRQSFAASWICTAHTKSDQAETVLMRILSGSGMYGLQGIRAQNGKVVRPLLDFSRDAIQQYAEENNIPFREDASNDDVTIRRNWIRHELLPQIEKAYNPAVVEALDRFSHIQTEYAEYMAEAGDKAFTEALLDRREQEIILDISIFRNYFTAIQKSVIFKCLSDLGFSLQTLNFPQMEQLIRTIQDGEPGSLFTFGKKGHVLIDRSKIFLSGDGVEWTFREPFHPDTEISLGKYRITTELRSDVTGLDYRSSNEMVAFFNWDDLDMKDLFWRTWEQGDTMKLHGGHTKKMSDIWIDNKIPVWEKSRIPLLASGSKILWAPGIKRSGTSWITKETRKILKLTAKIQDEY